MKNVADILEEAAALIEVHGHVKGLYGQKGVGFCAVGAIVCAAGLMKMGSIDAANFFTRYLGKATIPYWNDAPKRTPEEVIDALKLAAKDWRNEAALP